MLVGVTLVAVLFEKGGDVFREVNLIGGLNLKERDEGESANKKMDWELDAVCYVNFLIFVLKK